MLYPKTEIIILWKRKTASNSRSKNVDASIKKTNFYQATFKLDCTLKVILDQSFLKITFL